MYLNKRNLIKPQILANEAVNFAPRKSELFRRKGTRGEADGINNGGNKKVVDRVCLH